MNPRYTDFWGEKKPQTFLSLHIHLPLVEVSIENMQIQAFELQWLESICMHFYYHIYWT